MRDTLGLMDLTEVVSRIDAIRRRWWAIGRGGEVIETVGGGWIRLDERPEGTEFASTNRNRAQWNTARPPSVEQVGEAVETLRGRGATRAFLWFGPGAWSEPLGEALAERG